MHPSPFQAFQNNTGGGGWGVGGAEDKMVVGMRGSRTLVLRRCSVPSVQPCLAQLKPSYNIILFSFPTTAAYNVLALALFRRLHVQAPYLR